MTVGQLVGALVSADAESDLFTVALTVHRYCLGIALPGPGVGLGGRIPGGGTPGEKGADLVGNGAFAVADDQYADKIRSLSCFPDRRDKGSLQAGRYAGILGNGSLLSFPYTVGLWTCHGCGLPAGRSLQQKRFFKDFLFAGYPSGTHRPCSIFCDPCADTSPVGDAFGAYLFFDGDAGFLRKYVRRIGES